MNSAVVVTSLVRSHVVFKLLNYVTDKIVSNISAYVSAYLTTLARILMCVQTVRLCVCEREREREREGEIGYVLSVHNKA